MKYSAPDRGDVIWLDFSPQAGHEQAGRRPALVLSPQAYNKKTGQALVCPITSKAKGYPFEVELPVGLGVNGVVLADHIKNQDMKARNAYYSYNPDQKPKVDVMNDKAKYIGTGFVSSSQFIHQKHIRVKNYRIKIIEISELVVGRKVGFYFENFCQKFIVDGLGCFGIST